MRIRSWDRYELSFTSLNERLGDIPMREFRRDQLHAFVAERTKQVSPATSVAMLSGASARPQKVKVRRLRRRKTGDSNSDNFSEWC